MIYVHFKGLLEHKVTFINDQKKNCIHIMWCAVVSFVIIRLLTECIWLPHDSWCFT